MQFGPNGTPYLPDRRIAAIAPPETKGEKGMINALHTRIHLKPLNKCDVAVQTDSTSVEPLQQVSFDTGSQPDLGDDRVILELLSRIDELSKLLQQRIRRASHLHLQAGNDELSTVRISSVRNYDGNENMRRPEDNIRHLAVEEQPSLKF